MINVVNKYKHQPTDNDIYCARGSVLGNPFTVWMTAAGAGAMILIGASLVDLTDSLKTCKTRDIFMCN